MRSLSLLYRMMALHKYRIPEVDQLLIVEACIVLGVDTKVEPNRHNPFTTTGETRQSRAESVEEQFNTPTGVMEFASPAELDAFMARQSRVATVDR